MKKMFLGVALMATTLGSLAPMAAEARGHDRGRHWAQHDRGYRDDGYRNRYNERRYEGRRSCRSGGTTGLLLGGVAGALLGRAVDTRGDRTTGTVVGAGAGALLGREVDRGSKC